MDEQTKADAVMLPGRAAGRLDEALSLVRQALAGLRYGQIAITVQDGVVIQIERTERTGSPAATTRERELSVARTH